MLEPENNPNPALVVDPPHLLRLLFSARMRRLVDPARKAKQQQHEESRRQAAGEPHRIEYFHQLDDPYSHLSAQIVTRLANEYDVEIVPHLIRLTGGKSQPEAEKLAVWARRDAELIAPHYGLTFPADAATVPPADHVMQAARKLAGLSGEDFTASIADVSTALWTGRGVETETNTSEAEAAGAIDAGSARLQELGHYSGACFYYGGEFYWGVDRLHHLESRLRRLDAHKGSQNRLIVARPSLDVSDIDVRGALELHFYPSLNSPYTAIIFDKTVQLAKRAGVTLHHKPVLPMIMRGVPATQAKARYIFLDTKREAEHLGVPFGDVIMPIGEPTRRAYSLLPWAKEQGKDVALMSALLRSAFAERVPLQKTSGMRKAVEAAGLDWAEAAKIIGNEDWKLIVEQHQTEMVDGMGLWGVPSYRLCGPTGEPDLAVWGQDRLWLIAAEVRRRAALL